MPKTAQLNQPDLFASLMANSQKLAFAVACLQGHAFTVMMRYPIETLGFLKHRYEEDVKLVDDLIASDDVNEAFDIYAGFAEKAVEEYSTEAGKVATMSSELASESTKRIQKEAETLTRDFTAPNEKFARPAAA